MSGRDIAEGAYILTKDTVDSFGNGRYQMLRNGGYFYNQPTLLYGCDPTVSFDENQIESRVHAYYKMEPFLYVNGARGWTKLDYIANEILQSDQPEDFTAEDQAIFRDLEQGIGKRYYQILDTQRIVYSDTRTWVYVLV